MVVIGRFVHTYAVLLMPFAVFVSHLQKTIVNCGEAVFKIIPSRYELLPGERIQVVIEGRIDGFVGHAL